MSLNADSFLLISSEMTGGVISRSNSPGKTNVIQKHKNTLVSNMHLRYKNSL